MTNPTRSVNAFDPRRFAEWREESERFARLTPIFVIGPNKCGTSWMYLTLAAHPSCAGLGEESHAYDRRLHGLLEPIREFATPTQNVWPDQRWITLGDDEPELINRILLDRIFINGVKATRSIDDPDLSAFVEKTPAHSQHAMDLAGLYPNAKFVCCTRDIRDALVSAWRHMNHMQGSMTASTIHAFAVKYLGFVYIPNLRAARMAGKVLGPDRYFEVSYEERRADDDSMLQDLFEFLGLSNDASTRQMCIERSSFDHFTGGRQPGEEDDSFFRKGVVGDWRNHMTPEFAQTLVEFTNAALGEFATPASASRVG